MCPKQPISIRFDPLRKDCFVLLSPRSILNVKKKSYLNKKSRGWLNSHPSKYNRSCFHLVRLRMIFKWYIRIRNSSLCFNFTYLIVSRRISLDLFWFYIKLLTGFAQWIFEISKDCITLSRECNWTFDSAKENSISQRKTEFLVCPNNTNLAKPAQKKNHSVSVAINLIPSSFSYLFTSI